VPTASTGDTPTADTAVTVNYSCTWLHMTFLSGAIVLTAAIGWKSGDFMIALVFAVLIFGLALLLMFPVLVRKPLLRMDSHGITVFEAFTKNRVQATWAETERLVHWQSTIMMYGVIPIKHGYLGIDRQTEPSSGPAAKYRGAFVTRQIKGKVPNHIPPRIVNNSVATGVLDKRALRFAIVSDPRLLILDARRAKHQHYIEGP
jgi:hypothetical protein